VLARVLQQIGNHALDLRQIERKRRQFVVRQKIECQTALLKPGGPQPANFGKARVHVPFHKLHAQFSGFEQAEGQKVLDEVLQALSTQKHFTHDLALAVIERSELLTLQQLDVAVQNRQGRLQVMCGRGQSSRRLAQTIAQL